MKPLFYIDKIPANIRSQFDAKVRQVSNNLGLPNPDWLMAVMYSESKLNPAIKNPIGCVGLTQFCPDKYGGSTKTIAGKKYLLSDISKMSAIQQLDLIQAYFMPYKSKLKSYQDLALLNFFPIAVGKPDSFVIKSDTIPASKIYSQNPAIAKFSPKQGEITVGTFKRYIDNIMAVAIKQSGATDKEVKKISKDLGFAERHKGIIFWGSAILMGSIIYFGGRVAYKKYKIFKDGE